MQAVSPLRWGFLSKKGKQLVGEWPIADLPDGRVAVRLVCHSAYDEQKVKKGRHLPIFVMVANYTILHEGFFTWQLITKAQSTLDTAKLFAERYVQTHPQLFEQKRRRTK